MDPFKLLKTDHKKVSQLFKEIEAASAGSSKSQLFSQLKSELDLHAHIEEKYLYPALENKKESREITLEAYEEHNVVKDLLAELAARSPDDEWDAKLTVLKENVEHHVEEEEGELFDKAESVLSKEQLQRLGAEMEAEKAAKNGGQAKRAGAGTKSSKKAAAKTRPAANKESPGVLTRLAKLVGLAGDEPSPARKTSTRKPAKKAAKKASSSTKGTRKSAATTTKSSLARKSAKRQPATKKKAASRTSTKTKKTASKKK